MPGVDTIRGQVQAYLDFCRIEKGLAENSLAAYRRDLEKFTVFLGDHCEGQLPGPEGMGRYIDSLYRSGLASRSIARHLATLRGFCGFLLREGAIVEDPTAFLVAPKQWTNLPKYLNSSQINSLVEAPKNAKLTGVRDRAMLELLYAAGLRVSELCQVELSDLNPEMGVLRITGKGGKQRIVPVGRTALRSVESVPGIGSPRSFAGAGQPLPVRYRQGRPADPPGLLEAAGGPRQEGRHFSWADAARHAPHVRHPPAGGRRRFAQRSDHAGSCGYLDDPDLHSRSPIEAEEDGGGAPSPGMTEPSGVTETGIRERCDERLHVHAGESP